MITRRRFVGLSVATGATILAGGKILGSTSAPGAATNTTFKIGGDLEVNRLGFGAMRLTGEGVWGWPPDRANAIHVLKRTIDLGQVEHALLLLLEAATVNEAERSGGRLPPCRRQRNAIGQMKDRVGTVRQPRP